MFIALRAIDLKEGDMVDLEGDQYADPSRDNQLYPFMLNTVTLVEQETADCVAVYFEGGPVVGFPIDHLLPVETQEG